MPLVHRQDPPCFQSLGRRDHYRVGQAQVQSAVLRKELPATFKIGAGERLQQERSVLKALQEVELGLDTRNSRRR
jgi:hypothetical protein